ncbi:hypothetical protein ACHHYP_01203 [Achlya hypogyna]|uniref:C2 domain-containing protein n=1 Tax=Achlya hypogyna TaxID=1202772 RepID=A0A1V9ZTL2_ACHHY|nr:hypothetical protein ACHHYP_01203 [Achlya hypogyna]
MEEILVTVVRAENILGSDGFGPNKTSDPYVVLTFMNSSFETMRSREKRTGQVMRTVNPVWNETILIGDDVDVRTVSYLSFSLFDKNMLRDVPLGQVNLGMQDVRNYLHSQGPIVQSYKIESVDRMKAPATGELFLRFELNQRRPSAPNLMPRSSREVSGRSESSDSSATFEPLTPPNVLVVKVENAKDLPSADSNGASDPFVRITVGNEVRKTSTKYKTLTPVWNESFEIPVSSLGSEVLFEVCDEDKHMGDLVTTSNFLGKARFSIDRLTDGQKRSVPIQLLNKKFKNKRNLGTLNVTVQWVYKSNVDDIVEANARRKVNLLEKVRNVVTGGAVPDAYDFDEELDPEHVKEVPKKTDEELRKEREDRERAREAERKALEAINIKSGDYSVQVHVIEASDLVAKDASGTSDPVVFVHVMDQVQHTATKKKALSAVWDDTLIFNFRNLDKDTVEMGSIKLRVMDANTLSRSELIGEAQFDVSYIYSNLNHQICNQWLALIAPRKGIQGYLRVSITITGPGDKFVHPPPLGPSQAGVDGVIVPPSIKQDIKFLVMTVHVGEHLPPMDSLFKGLRQGIDAYVEAGLGSSATVRTRVKSLSGARHLLNPAFHDELWLVLREPSLSNKITISTKAWDKVGVDQLVATSYQSLRYIKSVGGTVGPMWINLYGAPLDHAKGNILHGVETVKDQMALYPDMGSFYRGRLLVSFDMRVNKDLDEANMRVKATPLPRELYPPTAVYRLRAFVGSGSDIPQLASLAHGAYRNSKMQIVVTCGSMELNFERRENNKGIVVWNQLRETDNLVFPEDPDQIPDVFVYLCKGRVDGKLSVRKQVAFKRYSARQLMEKNMMADPEWIALQEDNSVDALGDEVFPGNIFLALGFGLEATANGTKALWDSVFDTRKLETRLRYQVQVNIFQGRQLPAMDDNGLCDPYVKVRMCGEEKRLKTRHKTVNPLWYETVTFEVDLPPVDMLHFAPPVTLRVKDQDEGISGSTSEYIGSAFVTISSNNVRHVNDAHDPPVPEWYPLMQQEEGDTEGFILTSVVVVRKDRSDMIFPMPRPIVPKMRKAYLEIIVLGLRDMKPFQFLPIQLPFIEFTLGGAKALQGSEEMITERSKRPSAANPNYLHRIVQEVELPEDPLFAPVLGVLVKDTRLGGWTTPTVGNCSIDMTSKLPWGKGYIPPQRMDFRHVEGIRKGTLHHDEDLTLDSTRATPAKQPSSIVVDTGAGLLPALRTPTPIVPTSIADDLAEREFTAFVDDTDATDAFETKRKVYMKDREELSEGLEAVLRTKPFEAYSLTIGQKKKKLRLLSLLNPLKYGTKKPRVHDTHHHLHHDNSFNIAGVFKGLVRVMLREDDPPLIDMERLETPMPYHVRVYVLNGSSFAPMDSVVRGKPSKSDPYLKLSIGKDAINDRKNYIEDTVDPDFYKMFEFHVNFPGASTLHIDALDHDNIRPDGLIGATAIDLEDRFFDKNWHALGQEFQTSERFAPKPVEERTLHIPTSAAPMGQLKLWVDILAPLDAASFTPDDIALPPPREFELRVVVWKTKEVPSFNDWTEMNDLFVRCELDGADHQDTDIHWRAKKGKASFNYRMKFPVTLGHKQHNSKFPRFKLQMWDKDIVTSNDCLAEADLDLAIPFKKALAAKGPMQVFPEKPKSKLQKLTTAQEDDDNETVRMIKEKTGLWDTDPTDSTWIKMYRSNPETRAKEPMGKVCISMQLVPKTLATTQPVGFGRHDPNNSPYLPPPAGRLKLSWNPYKVFNQLLGPKICHRVMCCLCCAVLMVLMYFLGPMINVLIVTFNMEEVRVTVIRAVGLVGNDGFGSNKTSDPYVSITYLNSSEELIKGETKKTKDIQKTVNPEWNETLIVGRDIDLRRVTWLALTVYDKNMLKDVALGRALVPMEVVRSALAAPTPIALEFPITKFSGVKVATGSIFIELASNAPVPVAAAAPGDVAIDVAGPPNVLIITVDKATGLKAMDSNGFSDPLVIISCQKEKFTTTTMQKTLTPVWNETFRMPLTDGTQEITFVVEDFDMLANDVIGKVKVPVDSLAHGMKQTLDLVLQDKKFKKAEGLGTLTVTMQWTYRANIDEIVESNKKKKLGIFDKMKNVVSGVPDAGDDDEEGLDPIDAKEVPKKSDEEIKKEAEEKEKAMQEEKKALEDINIKSGDYSIQVHVIEARDLAPKDATGTSDPVVFVDVLDQTQHTATKKQTLSAVWDDILIFNFRELDKEIVEMGTIKLRIMDANTLQRAELIGETQFDTSFIYSHINHQICNQWLGLIAPGQESVQGYLRVSITILGPGDKFSPPPPLGPANSGVDGVIMPPSIKQDVNFLVATVHVGEHLPPMDSLLGGLKQGLDAYVEASLGSNDSVRTRVKTKSGERHLLNPAFNDELWMVLREPGLANNITLAIKDWDKIGKDEVVAHSYQSLRLIKKLLAKTGAPTAQWLNLYGAPLEGAKGNILNSAETVQAQMNTFPDTASFYRGRLLVTFEIRSNEAKLEEVNRRVKATPLPKQLYPPTSVYRIRAFVGSGTDIPQITSMNIAKNSRMQIVITCGLEELCFERQRNEKGLVVWNQLCETDNLVFPSDPDQIPDVFVYLCKGTVGDKLNPRKQIAFKRYKAKHLLDDKMEKEPAWVTLKEDPCVDALGDEVFPGNILLALAMGTETTAVKTRPAWDARFDQGLLDKRHSYQVQVNLFQGRHLPALDDNGLSDPYAKIRLNGIEQKSEVKHKTRDPTWYQTFCYDVELPPLEMLHFSPQVIVRLMDHDNGITDSGHDYMGSAFICFDKRNVRAISDSSELPQPQWYPLMQQEEGDTEGQILASIVVYCLDTPGAVVPIPREIRPKMRKAFVEIIVLGLRDMKPFQFLPVQLPFIEFTLGGKTHANQEMKTEKSKRPSGANPNFLQRIVREVELPEDSLFAPMLNVMVRDTRLGGWSTPTIGNCSIDMSTKLPWGEGYIAPQRMSFSQVEEEDLAADDDSDADEDAPMLQGRRTAQGDIGAGVFGALQSMNVAIDLDDPALLSGPRHLPDGTVALEEEEDEAADEFEIKRKKFMKNRDDLSDGLESVLTTKPFETYALTIGQKKKKASLLSSLNPLKFGTKKAAAASQPTSTFHVAGIFKGLVRVILDEKEPPLINMEKLLNPLPYQVRVYVLNGTNFAPMDPSLDGTPGKSDPYLVLRLGKEKINDRKNFIEDVVDPDFYKVFEFNVQFPGASTLTIDAFDHDFIGGDDLIGSTTIDLEDRFFDKNWHDLGKEFKTTERWFPKPVEQRALTIPTSKAQMGQLKLWVDILTPKEAANYPHVDIAMPPAQHYELRVVIWKTKEVPSFDEITDMNDLFVRASLEGCDHQDTDIHWRAKKGKASFNWRMKFPVALGHKQHNSKFPYFKLQMWDKDIFSANDCIAEGIIDMSAHFKKVCQLKSSLQIYQDKTPKKKVKETAKEAQNNDAIRSIKEATGLWDNDPTDSTWIKMERLNRETGQKEAMGAVCISMELVPVEKAKVMTVGFGRSDPNNSPFLPPPAGRLKFSMNPFYVFNELLGPKICHRVMCCLCCLLIMVLMYFLGPIINLIIVASK